MLTAETRDRLSGGMCLVADYKATHFAHPSNWQHACSLENSKHAGAKLKTYHGSNASLKEQHL